MQPRRLSTSRVHNAPFIPLGMPSAKKKGTHNAKKKTKWHTQARTATKTKQQKSKNYVWLAGCVAPPQNKRTSSRIKRKNFHNGSSGRTVRSICLDMLLTTQGTGISSEHTNTHKRVKSSMSHCQTQTSYVLVFLLVFFSSQNHAQNQVTSRKPQTAKGTRSMFEEDKRR